MENFLIMLGVFVICFAAVGVVGLIVYAILRAIEENLKSYQHTFTKKRLKISILVLIIFCAGYIAFRAVYPSDDFYFHEFETITLRKIPASVNVLTKSATYPDLHGDYKSTATIELSASDYQQLFEQIQQDKRFDKLTEEKKFIEFQQVIEQREDKLYDIKFYADGKTIKIDLINY